MKCPLQIPRRYYPASEVFHAAHRTKRGLSFLFVSGYGSDSLPEPFGGRSVLQKPFVTSKLKDAIEAILDR